MTINLRSGRINLRLGGEHVSQISKRKFADEWLQEIADRASIKIRISADRKINTVLLERQLNDNLKRIMKEAENTITNRIMGKITSTIPNAVSGRQQFASTGYTSFTINDSMFNAALGPKPIDSHSRRYNASLSFSNRGLAGAGRNPWLNGAPDGITAKWQNLKRSTWKKKRRLGLTSGEASKFFVQSKDLSNELRGGLLSAPPKLVEIKSATVLRQNRDARGRFAPGKTDYLPEELVLKNLRISLFPGISRKISRTLIGAQWDNTMALEEWLGVSEESRKKLKGPKSVATRHLIQPVMSYYLRREAPRAISYAIQRAALT